MKDLLNDPRVVYSYSSEVLSFVENFNQGLNQCTGEYVTIIGDDDGINPRIMEITEMASRHKIEAITPSLPVVYYWPDSGVPSVKENGKLQISHFSSTAQFFKCQNEIKKLLENGCQSYLTLKLAKVYHGVVKKAVLDKIKEKTGKYIGGLSPDIYLSIAASLLTDKVLFVDYPLTISGICKKSGSSDSATGKHTGQLSEAPHFRGHENYNWSDKVPAFYSVDTIWADSALAAITDLKFEEVAKDFKVDILSAHCLLSYPAYREFIVENLAKNLNVSKNSPLLKAHLQAGVLKVYLNDFFKKIRIKIFHRTPAQEFNDIPDINAAANAMKNTINSNANLIDQNIQKALKTL